MIHQDQLFNEYYFDLLKKLKSIARNNKQDSHNARVILRAIKKNYSSYDKFSSEFRVYVSETSAEAWSSYAQTSSDSANVTAWMQAHPDMEIYKDIPLTCVESEFTDVATLHHYLTLLSIFRKPISDADLVQVVEFMKSNATTVEAGKIEDAALVEELHKLKSIQMKQAEKMVKDRISAIPDIEDTSLGKLAKEIMQEMNVEELQSSLGNGDIMQALANPDGGLVKLLGTVSQKMISKMSSGEIKQENLLQDAMKLASQIGGKEMNALGSMASLFNGAAGGSGGFELP